MAKAIAAARSGLRRLVAISTFAPPTPAAAATVVEPGSNSLLVSAKLTNSINRSNPWSFSPLYGSRRLFSISAFTPPQTAAPPPPAEPNCNLFVSGLSKRTTSEGLREAFEKFGQVVQARVVTDRVSGYSKGFGFVRYASLEEAAKGKEGMDGKFLDGWVIFAEYAKPRPPPSQQPQTSEPSSGYRQGYQPSQSSNNYQSPSGYQPSQSTSEPPYNYQPPSGYHTSQSFSDYQPSSGHHSPYQPTQPLSDYHASSGYQPPQSQSTYHPSSGYQPTYPSSSYQSPSGYQTSHPSSNYQTPTGYQNSQTSVDYQTPSAGCQAYQPTQQNLSGYENSSVYQNAPGGQTAEPSSGSQSPSGANNPYEASA